LPRFCAVKEKGGKREKKSWLERTKKITRKDQFEGGIS
jgi:hypothetical protein